MWCPVRAAAPSPWSPCPLRPASGWGGGHLRAPLPGAGTASFLARLRAIELDANKSPVAEKTPPRVWKAQNMAPSTGTAPPWPPSLGSRSEPPPPCATPVYPRPSVWPDKRTEHEPAWPLPLAVDTGTGPSRGWARQSCDAVGLEPRRLPVLPTNWPALPGVGWEELRA